MPQSKPPYEEKLTQESERQMKSAKVLCVDAAREKEGAQSSFP